MKKIYCVFNDLTKDMDNHESRFYVVHSECDNLMVVAKSVADHNNSPLDKIAINIFATHKDWEEDFNNWVKQVDFDTIIR